LGAALRAAEQAAVAAAQYLRPLFKFYPGLEAARRLMTQWCLQAGMAEIRAGRLAAAEDRFREGLAINPDRAELHGRLGLVYAQQRRLPEALDQFEAVPTASSPPIPGPRCFLGACTRISAGSRMPAGLWRRECSSGPPGGRCRDRGTVRGGAAETDAMTWPRP
jgi:tetratricopeptide (TPR) repeat protein